MNHVKRDTSTVTGIPVFRQVGRLIKNLKWKNCISQSVFKETGSANDPPCKDCNVWFTTVLSDQVWKSCFCSFNWFFFHLRVLCESNYFCLLEAIVKFSELNRRKTTVSFTFFMRLRFQGYCCKSGIAIFAWRIYWNYAYTVPLICLDPFLNLCWALKLLL